MENKIALEILEPNDIELVRSWRNSELINNVSYNRSFITQEMQQNWFNKICNDSTQRHWIISYQNQKIGYASIKNIDNLNKRCEFSSLYIGEERFLMSGIGAVAEYMILKEIFETYTFIEKIFCEVLEFNSKVIQLHKKFGFETEGILKSHYIINDKKENIYILSLFKNIWDERKLKIEKILRI